MVTVWIVDSQAGQQITDSASPVHIPPAVRNARLAVSDTPFFSTNARTRATWGYKAAILCPRAERHGVPALAPHLGHGTVVKSGFIPGPCAETQGEESQVSGRLTIFLQTKATVGDLDHKAMWVRCNGSPVHRAFCVEWAWPRTLSTAQRA